MIFEKLLRTTPGKKEDPEMSTQPSLPFLPAQISFTVLPEQQKMILSITAIAMNFTILIFTRIVGTQCKINFLRPITIIIQSEIYGIALSKNFRVSSP